MRSILALLLLGVPSGALPRGFPAVPIRGVAEEHMAMPLFGIGTWQYNETRSADAVGEAFRMGYRHVDTALIYKNQVGVGKALKESGVARGEFFVTTKIPGGLNATATTQALDQCLKELDLDYVDLMLLHFPADFNGKGGAALRREQWKALEAWAKAGKARAIGTSHYCQRQLEDVLSVAEVPIAVNQVQYHVGMGASSRASTDDMAFARSHGILYESFSPLCGPCTPPDNKELITGPLVTRIGKAHKKSGPQVALRWLVQQGIPVIPKSSAPRHIRENMELFDFNLTASEMAELTAAVHPAVGGGPGPQDSGDCGIADAAADIVV